MENPKSRVSPDHIGLDFKKRLMLYGGVLSGLFSFTALNIHGGKVSYFGYPLLFGSFFIVRKLYTVFTLPGICDLCGEEREVPHELTLEIEGKVWRFDACRKCNYRYKENEPVPLHKQERSELVKS